MFSATKSDVGASDVSVEFAQHESNSSLSDIDLQYTATIHNPERSLHQGNLIIKQNIQKWLLWGRWGWDWKSVSDPVIGKLQEQKEMENADRPAHSS